MKKVACLLLIAFLFVFSACSTQSANKAFSFRDGITFGMMRDEIIDKEGREPDSGIGSTIYYKGEESAGVPAEISYTFKNGFLRNINVSFDLAKADDNQYERFQHIRTSLVEKYGEPAYENLPWEDASNQESIQSVLSGSFSARSMWSQPGGVSIDLSFTRLEKGELWIGLFYYQSAEGTNAPNTDGI